MSERTDTRTRDTDVDLDTDFGIDDDVGVDRPSSEDDGLRGRIPGGGSSTESKSLRGRLADRVGGWFSIRTFGVTLLLTVALSLVAGMLIPVVPASGLVGVFLAGFLLGIAKSDSHYLEVASATLLSGAVTAVLGNLFAALVGVGIPLMAIGAGASGLAGVIGHYVGRDLKDGLTREI